jgi:glycosyltransferase involved in cell wall biosynthesis
LNSLSVIVITKDEEGNIVKCLESVRWAGEIVVVDCGSEDRTVELAKGFTRKVYEKPWEGYSAAKNYALQQSTGKWILWIDADERASDELANEIQALTDQGDHGIVGYEIPRKAFFLGRWIRHCGWYPGYVMRLFRRDAGTFSANKVHERFEIKGQVSRLKSDLLHFTDPNLWHYFGKFNRYTSLAAEELSERKSRFRVSQLILRPAWVFVRMYFIKMGFLDGIQGFILSVLSACYVFTKYAKLWELSVGIERSNT